MDRIVLSGMQFFGYHGTRPEETTLGQRFEVTVTVGLDLQAAATADDLTLGVDYSRWPSVSPSRFWLLNRPCSGSKYKYTNRLCAWVTPYSTARR